jgi:hypothetical protein
MNSDASRFSTLAGLYGDGQKLKESSREFDLGYGLDRDKYNTDTKYRGEQLSLDHLNSDRNYDLGKRDINVRRAGILAETDRFGQQLAFDKDKYAGDSAFRNESFAEDKNRYALDHSLAERRLDLDWYGTKKGVQAQNSANNSQRNSQYLSTAATIIGAIAMFSDVRLKTSVVEVPDVVGKLRGVSWGLASREDKGRRGHRAGLAESFARCCDRGPGDRFPYGGLRLRHRRAGGIAQQACRTSEGVGRCITGWR